MEKTRLQAEDEICNKNWDALLKVFHGIGESTKDGKVQYLSLKEVAQTNKLSPRQLEGILERCDYQISLIDNPSQKPFSNMFKEDTRTVQVDKAKPNGKH